MFAVNHVNLTDVSGCAQAVQSCLAVNSIVRKWQCGSNFGFCFIEKLMHVSFQKEKGFSFVRFSFVLAHFMPSCSAGIDFRLFVYK